MTSALSDSLLLQRLVVIALLEMILSRSVAFQKFRFFEIYATGLSD